MKSPSSHRLTAGLAALGTVFAATLHAQPAGTGTNAVAVSPAQFAHALLKRSADKLSASKAFSVEVNSSAETVSPGGPVITYFAKTEVTVQRPDKLAAKRTGDGPSFDVFYDGKTFAALDRKQGLYARMDAPPTLEALVPVVSEKTGMTFPFADFVMSDVYRALTNGVTFADFVGRSTVGGIECDHLVFSGPGVEWQIWVGPEKDPLPRRLAVTYPTEARQPRFTATFSDWDLKARPSASRFELKPPAKAKVIEFRPHAGATAN